MGDMNQVTSSWPPSSDEPVKIERLVVSVEFSDGRTQEYVANEPWYAKLSVDRDPPIPVDLSAIPVTGGHTFTLTCRLGGAPLPGSVEPPQPPIEREPTTQGRHVGITHVLPLDGPA